MPEKSFISILKRPATWYYVVMAIFGLLYFTIAFTNHYLFRSYTEDYGFFNFVLYDFAHGRISEVPTMLVYKAHANIFFNHLFLEYCSRMAKPSLEKSEYLQTIGNGLHPDIDIFWTGI